MTTNDGQLPSPDNDDRPESTTQALNRIEELGTLLKIGDEIDATQITIPNGPKMHEFKLIRKNIVNTRKLADN